MASRQPISFPQSGLARRAIENAIETLIGLLDAADGDCDLEDDQEDDALDRSEGDPTLVDRVPIYGVDQTGQIIGWADPRIRQADHDE